MIGDGVKIEGLKEVQDFLAALPEEMYDKAKGIFRERAFAAQRTVSNNLVNGPLYSRTGNLRKSIKPTIRGTELSKLKGGIFASTRIGEGSEVVKYAPIHEYGGTIRAKNAYRNVPGGPYLNIPTSANKTPAGVTRFSPGQVFTEQEGFIAKMKSGVYGVFRPDGEGVQLMYSLHKQVEIPARLGMREAVEDEIPTLLSQLKAMQL